MNNLEKLGKIEEELENDNDNDIIMDQFEYLEDMDMGVDSIEDHLNRFDELDRKYNKSDVKEKHCGLCYGVLRGEGNVSKDFGNVCNRCNLELSGLSSGIIYDDEGDICKYCGSEGDIGIMSWNGLDLEERGDKICKECLGDIEINLTGSADKCMSCNRKGFGKDCRYLEFGDVRGVSGLMCDKCLGKKGIKLGGEVLLRKGSYPSEAYVKDVIEDLLGSGRYLYLGKVKGIDNVSLLNDLEDMRVYFQLVLGGKDYYDMVAGDRRMLNEFGKEVVKELEKKFVGFRFRVKVGVVPE